MPGVSYKGPSEPASPLEKTTEANLAKHIKILAGDIGQRNRLSSLKKARDYIADTMSGYGYKIERQDYSVGETTFANLQAELPGRTDPSEIILVGAHYDSVCGSPGANDNGSGVATVLELARQNAGKLNARTIRFVFFGSEEPPFFSSSDMGSYHCAERCFQRKENIKGLLVMETLGYYTDKPGTQTYPCKFVPGYPTTGNFICFVGNMDSRPLIEKCVAIFRKTCNFPSEGVAAPNWVNGVDWSDQYWFWKRNYPALMITDTALYRYPYYHSLQDTPDKINYPCFARVVAGLSNVLHGIASK
jgi:Zn-dependent M28 family amino/carboxypeptidase